MIIFFLVAGLMLIVALAFVLIPLFGKRFSSGGVSHGQTNLSIYRDQLQELESDLVNATLDQAQYETAKRELERRALEEYEDEQSVLASGGSGPNWTLATIVAVLIPLVTVSFYLALGTPVALDKENVTSQVQEGHDLSPERLLAMIDGINDRLRSNPDDVDSWHMLAKTSQAIGKFPEAAKAYRELIRRVPPDAQLLADFADTLAVVNGRSLVGEPQELIEQALKLDPKNIKALALGGTVSFQKQEFSQAAARWRQILDLVPADAEFAQRIRESVADAEQRARASVVTGNSDQKLKSKNASVSGNIVLDSAVAKAVSSDDTVFVFARAANGPRMPLAILRMRVKDIPASFELTEAMSMAPEMSISKFSDLLIGARISKSGNATPQPGDWESELVPAKVGVTGLSLVIAHIVR